MSGKLEKIHSKKQKHSYVTKDTETAETCTGKPKAKERHKIQ